MTSYDEEQAALQSLEDESSSSWNRIRSEAAELAREEREKRYETALRQLNDMLSKAEQFNETCEELASEAPATLRKEPELFVGGTLRDYQLEGVRWLQKKHWVRVARLGWCCAPNIGSEKEVCLSCDQGNGVQLGESGIIADEMGLGKTIQIIAYVAWCAWRVLTAWLLFYAFFVTDQVCWDCRHAVRCKPVEDGPVLIVVPLSTLRNWVQEFNRFAPSIPVVEYHGTPEYRAELRREYIPHLPASAQKPAKAKSSSRRKPSLFPSARWTKEERATMPVFVTTYAIAMQDRMVLGRSVVPWGLLVVDESHRLKRVQSKLKEELESYCHLSDLGGTQKVILTGTPVQNDLVELWSLCNFVMPLIFADRDAFANVYGFLQLETEEGKADLYIREQRDNIIATLHRLLARYILRRTKADVKLSIPPKVEVLVYCEETKEQRVLKQGIIERDIQGALDSLGLTTDRQSERAAVSLQNSTMQHRKVADHPWLFGEPRDLDEDGSADERIVHCSGKMKVLDRMLHSLKAAGHKVLIFSQFVRVIDILSDYMTLRHDSFGDFGVLDGSTPHGERQESMDRFNDDPDMFAFLLSTRAGGLGVNLTGADTVIIFDSDWNPHGDTQAEDRVHRIGQTKPVVVYRLVTTKSIEEVLIRRANSKRALERVVLREGHPPTAPTRRGRKRSPPAKAPDSSPPSKRRRAERRGASAPGNSPGSSSAQRSAEHTTVNGATAGNDTTRTDSPLVTTEDLQRWLRDDVTTKGESGISSRELDHVLDRSAVMDAGERLLASVLGHGAEEKTKARGKLPVVGKGFEVVFHTSRSLASLMERNGSGTPCGSPKA